MNQISGTLVLWERAGVREILCTAGVLACTGSLTEAERKARLSRWERISNLLDTPPTPRGYWKRRSMNTFGL